MAVEAPEFFSENNQAYFLSQNYNNFLISNPNFSYLSSLQQQQQQQQHQKQQEYMEMGCYNNNNNFNQGLFGSNPCSSSNATSAATFTTADCCLPFFDELLAKQSIEVDQYLHFQGEKLKEAIQEQKRQQMLVLAKSYESKSMAIIKEKEENLEKLRLKSKTLEEYLKKAEQETLLWQTIAREKEEMVIGLNNMLLLAQQQQQQSNIIYNNNNTNNNNYYYYHTNNNNNHDIIISNENDAESVCSNNSNNRREEIEEEEIMQGEKVGCKWCKTEMMSVVLLPCKHLCCCKTCEPFLGFCPLCHSLKEGSIEVFF